MTSTPNGPRPGGQSRWADLGGPVRYLDFGGPADGPTIVCVHGLGGSAVNWWAIAPLLTDRYRVLAPDLAGHGLTRSLGRGTDVASNRALLHRFIEEMAAGPVILMGNSMGGMISMIEAVAAPSSVAGLILLDPAVPVVPARPDPFVAAMFALYVTPGVGRLMMDRRRHQAPETVVANIMSLVCADPARVPADAVAQHVEVARQRAAFPGINRDYAAAIRSVVATAGRSQSYRRGIRFISCPVLVVHGDRDRLVPLAAARAAVRANPSWSLVVLAGVGHVPQLEVPQDTAQVIAGWLGAAGRRAAEAAASGSAASAAPAH
jgi:pimeloyl-ACP methyl ester carboxylesterase